MNIPIYNGSSNFQPGDTPFGFYDYDPDFQNDANRITKFCAQRLGYPIMEVELQDINLQDIAIGKRSSVDLKLEGIDVFNFAIRKAPNSIFNILKYATVPIDIVDYFFLHQANLFMNETIRKKIKANKEKVPNSIQNFGNTNGASIPLTILRILKLLKNLLF